ncbi:MAG: class I SAM-dependent methyltransferase [Deltaproteobacteria bacterium]|nr:class I SAM-dependent methyltransferase [Deltaproteobacteria bacterium]
MDLRERAPSAPNGPAVRHPWEQARARFVLERLAGISVGPGTRLLDVGAGDGWLAGEIQRATGCRVTCWDHAYRDDDEQRLRERGVAASRVAPTEQFDVALLLDVLEHADDDLALLRSAALCVRPGGHVLVTVPAWPALFSAHDRALCHRRRYTPATCRRLLQRAELVVDEAGGLFHGLLAARALAVLLERVGVGADASIAGVGHWRAGPMVSGAVTAMLRAEQHLSLRVARRGLELPGLSWFALCTRPALGSWQSAAP